MTDLDSPATVERFNPSTWNQAFAYDQGQLRTTPARVLHLAGQAAISADGTPSLDGMAGQLAQSMDNVEQLLGLAGLGWADVLTMTVYVTDMDAALAAYAQISDRLRAADATPPATLVGVTRLAIPPLLAEITISAGR